MHNSKYKLLILILLCYFFVNSYSQSIRSIDKSNLKIKQIKDINNGRNVIDAEKIPRTDSSKTKVTVKLNCQNPASGTFTNKYRLISTYVPTENEKVKFININFNIFQDHEGKNNFQPSTNVKDLERLQNMLAWINEIYAKQPWCETSQSYNSDPPQGAIVKDLTHKYIQFHLTNIYEYKDKTPDEGLWKSNNSRLLLNRIAETDSNRLKQLNICFTEKHYLGSVREIKINNPGSQYAHPLVIINSKTGKNAKAFASVVDGHIKAIDLIDGGMGYEEKPEILIAGGNGYGAKAIAHVNTKTKSLQRIEVIDGGRNYNYTRIEIKGGGGSGATAYVENIKKGKIKSIYVAQKGFSYYDDPEVNIITDTKGEGAELIPLLRGATGFTLTPSVGDADLYIVEKSLWNKGNPDGDYAAATNIVHELGHVLDLLHTYSSANETNNNTHHDYMWDLFGYDFSGFHTIEWGKDPCISPADKVSNNLMGGNQISQYTSPMQIGKMHRALHIYNVKKYTDCTCDTKKIWTINSDEIWDFSFKSYNPITIKSGASLTLHCTLEMPDGCDIVVENEAQLIIEETGLLTGGCNKAWNGKLIIKKGADFKVKTGGIYLMEDLGKLIIE